VSTDVVTTTEGEVLEQATVTATELALVEGEIRPAVDAGADEPAPLDADAGAAPPAMGDADDAGAAPRSTLRRSGRSASA
jgi:hypothetical protein